MNNRTIILFYNSFIKHNLNKSGINFWTSSNETKKNTYEVHSRNIFVGSGAASVSNTQPSEAKNSRRFGKFSFFLVHPILDYTFTFLSRKGSCSGQ